MVGFSPSSQPRCRLQSCSEGPERGEALVLAALGGYSVLILSLGTLCIPQTPHLPPGLFLHLLLFLHCQWCPLETAQPLVPGCPSPGGPRLSLMQHCTPNWMASVFPAQAPLLRLLTGPWQALSSPLDFSQCEQNLRSLPHTPRDTVRSSEWLIEDSLTWLS